MEDTQKKDVDTTDTTTTEPSTNDTKDAVIELGEATPAKENEPVTPVSATVADTTKEPEVASTPASDTPAPGIETTHANASEEEKPATAETSDGDAEKKDNTGMKIAAVAIVGAIAFIGYSLFGTGGSAPDPNDILGLEGKGPVATVNGIEIPRDAYTDNVGLLIENARIQGIDLEDIVVQTQIKEQVVGTLVNTQLLLQAAQSANVIVSDEEIQNEFATVETQFGGEEGLQTELDNVGLSLERLKANIQEQLTITRYIEEESGVADIAVSDTEIITYYDELVANAGEGGIIPPLAEIRDGVEAEVLRVKQQEALDGVINGLKEDAEIEILI